MKDQSSFVLLNYLGSKVTKYEKIYQSHNGGLEQQVLSDSRRRLRRK